MLCLRKMLTQCCVSSQDNHCPSCLVACSFISCAVIETDAGLACRANVIIAPRGGQLWKAQTITNTHTYTHSLSRMTNGKLNKKRTWKQNKVLAWQKRSLFVCGAAENCIWISHDLCTTHPHACTPADKCKQWKGMWQLRTMKQLPYKVCYVFCTAAAAAELLLPAVAQIRMLSCCTFVYRLATVPVAALAIPAVLLSRTRAIQAPIALQILWNARLIPEEPQFGLHFAAAKGPHTRYFLWPCRGYISLGRRHLWLYKVYIFWIINRGIYLAMSSLLNQLNLSELIKVRH